MDDLLRARLDAPQPGWLAEHERCGLPTHDELAALLEDCFAADGFGATALAMPNDLLCSMIVLADCDPAVAPAAAASFRRHGRDWAALLAGATFGASFRAGWTLERTDARVARIPGDLDRDGLQAAVDALRRTVALDTEAGLRLWLSPDWTRPETWLGALARYVAHAPADGSTCLCVDVGGAGRRRSPPTSPRSPARRSRRSVHSPRCCSSTAHPTTARSSRVHSGADVLAALGIAQPPPPEDPEQIVARARAAASGWRTSCARSPITTSWSSAAIRGARTSRS